DLRRIVGRCLQADPDRRFQVMDDVAMALEEVDLTADAATTGATSPRSRRGLARRVAAIVVVAAAAAGLAWWLKPVRAARPLILTHLTMDSGLTLDPVLSPD